MSASPNRPYIPALDQVRGAAALLVLFYHGFQLIGSRLAFGAPFDPARHWVVSWNPLVAVVEEGHTGVALFIVLSGFVLTMGAFGRAVDYRRFMASRALRIYPALVVLLVVAACAHTVSLGDVLSMLPPFGFRQTIDSNFVAIFWTVSVEFQCYLVFPFLLVFTARSGLKFLLGIVLLATVLRALAVFGDAANARDLTYWTVAGRIDQFCIGMIAARLYGPVAGPSRRAAVELAMAATAVVALLLLFNHAGGWPSAARWKVIWSPVEGTMWAVLIVCYLRAANPIGTWLARALTWIGQVSYPLYLTQFVLINVVIANRIYVRLTGYGHVDALVTTTLCVLPPGLAIAALMHSTIEMPFMRLRPKYIRPLSQPARLEPQARLP